MFRRYFGIGAFLLVCCCASPSRSELSDLPPKNVLEAPGAADPQASPTTIGKSWTPEQQQLMKDVTTRLTDRMCDVVDDVLKPYMLANVGFALAEWSMPINLWFDPAGRATRVTFEGTSTRPALDQLLLSSIQRIHLKHEIPSWLPMPVRTRLGRSNKIHIGGCRLKSLRST